MNNVAYLFGAAPVMPIAATPTAGYYYQTKKGQVPWNVAKIAYQDSGLTDVRTGLFLMNDNPANDHIAKAKTGWESYNIKGLQFNPKYAEGDATAVTGSGKAYPLVWLPPLDGRTPDEMTGGGGVGPAGPAGSQGRTGEKGEKGDKGDKGDPGAPGHTPTAAEIKALISDFMEENPVAGQVSAAELARAVENYMKENPVAQGARGPQGLPGKDGAPGHTPTDAEIKALISDFMEENPVAGQVSAADLAKAVDNYMKENPIAQGARGPQGLPGATGAPGARGATGAPGRAPTAAEIANAVSSYMQENPVSSGGGAGFDLDQARDFVDARIRVALRNFKPDVQEASVNWLGIFAAGIAAAALVGSMKSMKRVKGLKSLTGGSVVRVQ